MLENIFQGGNQIGKPVIFNEKLIITSIGAGEILTVDPNLKSASTFRCGGAPSAVGYDSSGLMHIADISQKAILFHDGLNSHTFLNEYFGKSFKGPNSLIFDNEGTLYFTDSGPIGETTLFNPTGSLYAMDKKTQHIQPLIHNALAYPSGLALSPKGTTLYVCETMANRLLRGVQNPLGVWHFSVFFQFSGSLGPMAVAVHPETEYVYVGMFDFKETAPTSQSQVLLISPLGGGVEDSIVVNGTQISGLCFSENKRLFITESSTNTVYGIQQ